MSDFKSTLPPRKRAKTKEEKEQRRLERIMRNRKAACQSREKKRKYVESLESYIVKLTETVGNLKYNQDLLLKENPELSSQLKPVNDLSEYSNFKFETPKKPQLDYMENTPISPDSVSNSSPKEPVFQPEVSHDTQIPNSVSDPEISVSDSESLEVDPLLIKPIDDYLLPGSITPGDSPLNLSLYDNSNPDFEHNSEVVVA